MHDCIRHLTNCQKNMTEEIRLLKQQLEEVKDFNKDILNELGVMKMIMTKHLNVSSDLLNHAQVYKKTKIVDNTKIYIIDEQYCHFSSQYWFDVSFESKSLSDENLVCQVYFAEDNKDEYKIVLKKIIMKNRAGSVQIKLSVPAPDISTLNMRSVIKNGFYIGLSLLLNENTLHEVRYYYDAFKAEDSGLDEHTLSQMKISSSTWTFMQVEILEPKLDYIRKFVKRSEIENANNFTIES